MIHQGVNRAIKPNFTEGTLIDCSSLKASVRFFRKQTFDVTALIGGRQFSTIRFGRQVVIRHVGVVYVTTYLSGGTPAVSRARCLAAM